MSPSSTPLTSWRIPISFQVKTRKTSGGAGGLFDDDDAMTMTYSGNVTVFVLKSTTERVKFMKDMLITVVRNDTKV